MSRRWVYSVEKKYGKLKQEQIWVSLASHLDCSFLSSSAFKALFCSLHVFRAKTKSSTGSEKYIEKFKKTGDAPFLCVFYEKKRLCFPFTPSGKADLSDGSICQGCPPRPPCQLSLCKQESSSWLPQHSSCAMRSWWAKDLHVMPWPWPREMAPFPICCVLLPSEDTKACEMSVGYRNLSGCSHDKTSLLKAIERDGVFYCPVKDSAMSELEIWQLHPSHILTQQRQQMLQEDYISSCALGLQGDYTFRAKGFRGAGSAALQEDFSVTSKKYL